MRIHKENGENITFSKLQFKKTSNATLSRLNVSSLEYFLT